MTKRIPDMRITYDIGQLGDQDVPTDPLQLFRTWFDEVRETDISEANALILTTVGADGRPDARTMLMKGFDERGVILFTNYDSKKGRDLAHNPGACLLFYWPSLQRQVRWHCDAVRVSDEESDAYFHSRPRGSQIGSSASPQSQPVASQEWLRQRFAELEAQYEGEDEIPRPDHWGGFLFVPQSIEFWQGRENRLHDRIRYTREEEQWRVERLAP